MTREEYNHAGGKVRITSTGDNSGRYGACECCGKYVSEVFIGNALRRYDGGFTYAGGLSAKFGHRSCVESLARRILEGAET